MSVEVIRNYDQWKLAVPPHYNLKEPSGLSGIALMIYKALQKKKEEEKKNVK